MTINITDKTIVTDNPNYLDQWEVESAISQLRSNNFKFCDLSDYAQKYFNWLLENEPERCFWKADINGWVKCSFHCFPTNNTGVVRIDCKPEPEFEYLPITIGSHGFYVIKYAGCEVLPTCFLAHKDFFGFVAPNGDERLRRSEWLEYDIDETWLVKMRINQS